jgi:hypothetical protein
MRPTFAALSVFGALLLAPVAAKALVVPINHSARVNIAGAAQSVVVGNPSIADVTVIDSHTVYVTGKSYGATNLVVLDRTGHALFDGDVTVASAGGSVSVYRGGQKSNVACDPGCTESSEIASGGGKSMVTSTLGAPASLQAAVSTPDAGAAAPR